MIAWTSTSGKRSGRQVERSILAFRNSERRAGRENPDAMYQLGVAAGVLWGLKALGLQEDRRRVHLAVDSRLPPPPEGDPDRAFVTGVLFGTALDPFD